MIRVQFETDQDEAVWWWLRGRNARWLGEDVRALAAEMPAGEARRLSLRERPASQALSVTPDGYLQPELSGSASLSN